MTEQATLFQLDQTTFDPIWGEHKKRAGLKQAETNRQAVLELARDLARGIAMKRADRTCTADDVQRALIDLGHKPSELGNAAGCIFLRREWEFTGRWTPSARVSNHDRANRIWRLR